MKRRGSSTAKLTVTNFVTVMKQFIIDVNAVVEIPPQLVFNWDQTSISIVQVHHEQWKLKDLNEWR